MSDRRTHRLHTPIAFGSETISELHLREPKAKDMRGMPADGLKTMDQVLTLVSRLSGQPEVVIDELSIEDLSEVSALAEGFTARSPATGPEPSR